MIRMICEQAAKIYVAQNKSDRAASAEAQLKAISPYNVDAVAFPDVAKAYAAALDAAGDDGVVVAGGSLYTVGEVISAHKRIHA
jgi:folylpolyglutamate synthase/dihydropteroate synthase